MISDHEMTDLLHATESRITKLLLLLAVDVGTPKSVAALCGLGRKFGVPEVSRWNVSNILARAKGSAVRLETGWSLTSVGKTSVAAFRQKHIGIGPASTMAHQLRQHLTKLQSQETRAFVEEAIGCLEAHLYRAAVVLSWVGSMSVLYAHIVQKRLADFNQEACYRDAKWRDAKNIDGLARMKEHDFLDILEAIGVLGKSVKKELQDVCLHLRNSCGHPNSFKVGEHRVAAHIETLVQNVFKVF